MTRDPILVLRDHDPMAGRTVPPPLRSSTQIATTRTPNLRVLRPALALLAAVALIGGTMWVLDARDWSDPSGSNQVPVIRSAVGGTDAVYFFVADRVLDPPWEAALIPAARGVDSTEDPVVALAEALLAGPLPDEQASDPPLVSYVPEGTRLLSLTFEERVVVVDLSAEFADADRPDRALAQVVFTLTRIEGVEGVVVLVEGTPARTLPIGWSLLDDPATRRTYEGYQPNVLIEYPARGAALLGGSNVTGVGNVHESRVGIEVWTSDGTLLDSVEVAATCLPGCRGDYDWASFEAPVTIDLPSATAGVVTAFGISEDGSRVDVRSQPVWLEPGPPAPPPSSSTTTSTVPSSVPAGETGLGPSPNTLDRLPLAEVPAWFAADWSNADNSGWCAALWPTAGLDGATARPWDRVSGGWGVAWDMPDAPGRMGDDEYCEACGSEAFGVAGQWFAAAPAATDRWDASLVWEDGSKAGYGYEGDEAPGSGVPLIASIHIEGQGCIYHAWTFLGEEHLVSLVDSLRMVDTLTADPVTPLPYSTDAPQSLGAAPWRTFASTEPSPTVRSAWAESTSTPGSCPLLTFADLGVPNEAPLARRGSESEFVVAWDLPDGPGRGPSYDYCVDCGRSAIGYAVVPHDGVDLSMDRYPITHTWDDGSFARVMSIGTMYSGGIPADRLEFRDGASGEALPTPPLVAWIQPEGFGCGYQIWSFLGDEHLWSLIGALRTVEGTT